jgi:hypothetical protein
MFCASQNLLAGVYLPESEEERNEMRLLNPQPYAARKEDTNHIFDDALASVREIFFYMAPLMGAWAAPPHPFLLPQHKPAPAGWVRHGPAALTRAWCLFELSKALASGCALHVLLSPDDKAGLAAKYSEEGGFKGIGKIFGQIDVEDAQVSKVDDREYILGEIEKAGGTAVLNGSVIGRLKEWGYAFGKQLLDALPASEQGTSDVTNNLGACPAAHTHTRCVPTCCVPTRLPCMPPHATTHSRRSRGPALTASRARR